MKYAFAICALILALSVDKSSPFSFVENQTFIIRSAISNLAFDLNPEGGHENEHISVPLIVKKPIDSDEQLWTAQPSGRSDGTYNILPLTQSTDDKTTQVLEYNEVYITTAVRKNKVATQAWKTIETPCGNVLIETPWNEDCIQFIGVDGPLISKECDEKNINQLWQILPSS